MSTAARADKAAADACAAKLSADGKAVYTAVVAANPTRETLRSVVERDPYAVLGVKPGVSTSELKKARDELLAIAHSDRVEQLHPALKEHGTELTREILDAYKALSQAPPRKAK